MEHEDETTETKKKSNKCQNKREAAETGLLMLSEAQCKYNKNDSVRPLMKRCGVDVTAESLLSTGNFEVSLIRQPLVVVVGHLILTLYFLPTLFPRVVDTF